LENQTEQAFQCLLCSVTEDFKTQKTVHMTWQGGFGSPEENTICKPMQNVETRAKYRSIYRKMLQLYFAAESAKIMALETVLANHMKRRN
jgi:hypothetical protein